MKKLNEKLKLNEKMEKIIKKNTIEILENLSLIFELKKNSIFEFFKLKIIK